MNKTRFAGTEDTDARDIAKAETQRADFMARRATQLQNRIREFFNGVEYVVFDSEESAPAWADNWFDFLLTGAVPEPLAVEAAAPELEVTVDNTAGEIEVEWTPEVDETAGVGAAPPTDDAADADFALVDEDDDIFPPPAA